MFTCMANECKPMVVKIYIPTYYVISYNMTVRYVTDIIYLAGRYIFMGYIMKYNNIIIQNFKFPIFLILAPK